MSGTGSGGGGGFGGGTGASGATGNAGGGLGAGGSIFARAGFSLTIQDSTFNGDSVVAGPGGGSPAAGGSALGQALFLGASVNYSVSTNTNTLAETIGGGNDPNAAGGFTKSGAGTLVLTGTESYVGSTTVCAGTLEMSNNPVPSTAITINSGAVLEYDESNPILQTATAYTGAGTLRVGSGEVIFGAGPVNVGLRACSSMWNPANSSAAPTTTEFGRAIRHRSTSPVTRCSMLGVWGHQQHRAN